MLASASRKDVHLTIGYPFALISRLLTWPFFFPACQNRGSIFHSGPNGTEGEQEENEVADHIRTLSREGSNLDPDIAEIVGNTLEMGQLKVQDVMVSRSRCRYWM